ncbi:MAG: SDR family oxidoreductase [Gemmatimonadetes bacterium]|nr:SDR family oxidoreductase [Gemmatimonadota bacterium]
MFGLGYTGRRMGLRILERGWHVTGTRTTEARTSELRDEGFAGAVFDGTRASAEVGEALRRATHVLSTIAPAEAGDPVLRHHRRDLEQAPELRMMAYLSTTGVYGDRGGGTVDESAEPRPGTDRSRRRVVAESAWQALAEGRETPLQIFRLAGIYGPGRSVLDRLRDGSAKRIMGRGLVFNRIHVADIVGAVIAGMDQGGPAGVFNLSDDEPAPPAAVVEYGAKLLGIDPPRAVALDEAGLSSTARSFYEENKRVSNHRLKADLGYRLTYPTYREGLEAIAATEG